MKSKTIVVLFVIITINFFLPRMMKADPFLYISDDDSADVITFSEDRIREYREYYGLDKPIHIQYFDYLKNLCRLNLGTSIIYNRPVSQIIGERIPWTIFIVTISIFASLITGSIVGALSAWNRNGIIDRFFYTFTVLYSQLPKFLVGTFILILFYTKFRTIPTAGGMSPFTEFAFTKEVLSDVFSHAILPFLSLTLTMVPDYYLTMRNSIILEMNKEYVITARAKGLKEKVIILKHCLVNSINPVITKLFMSMGNIFGGAVIVENIFSYPGVGSLMRNSVLTRDYTLIQGTFFIIALLVVFFSKLTEISYKLIGND